MPYIAKNLSCFTQKEIQAMFRRFLRAYKSPEMDVLIGPAIRDFGRILVVTPRKVGNSPERNRIRRRLKALFYENKFYERFCDLCIIIKRPGIDYDSQKLTSIVEAVLQQYATQKRS